MPERLTECLVERGHLTSDSAEEALERQVLMGGALDTALFELGLAEEHVVLDALSEAYGLEVASPRQASQALDHRALRALPEQWARKHRLAPLSLESDGQTLSVLTPAPADIQLVVRLGELLETTIRPIIAPEFRVEERLALLYGLEPDERHKALIASFGGRLPKGGPPAVSGGHDLDFSAAVARLRDPKSRDHIARTTLRHIGRKLDFSALFIVQDGFLDGWMARGEGAENVHGVSIPVDPDSAFRVVLDTKAHYLGPLAADESHEEFIRCLGRPHPRSVLIVPLRIQDRTVALLYAENGAHEIPTRLAADVMLFVSHVQAAMLTLLLRRKASTFSQLPASDSIETGLPESLDLPVPPPAEPPSTSSSVPDPATSGLGVGAALARIETRRAPSPGPGPEDTTEVPSDFLNLESSPSPTLDTSLEALGEDAVVRGPALTTDTELPEFLAAPTPPSKPEGAEPVEFDEPELEAPETLEIPMEQLEEGEDVHVELDPAIAMPAAGMSTPDAASDPTFEMSPVFEAPVELEPPAESVEPPDEPLGVVIPAPMEFVLEAEPPSEATEALASRDVPSRAPETTASLDLPQETSEPPEVPPTAPDTVRPEEDTDPLSVVDPLEAETPVLSLGREDRVLTLEPPPAPSETEIIPELANAASVAPDSKKSSDLSPLPPFGAPIAEEVSTQPADDEGGMAGQSGPLDGVGVEEAAGLPVASLDDPSELVTDSAGGVLSDWESIEVEEGTPVNALATETTEPVTAPFRPQTDARDWSEIEAPEAPTFTGKREDVPDLSASVLEETLGRLPEGSPDESWDSVEASDWDRPEPELEPSADVDAPSLDLPPEALSLPEAPNGLPVPDLSEEAWLQASSEVGKPKVLPQDVIERASQPPVPDEAIVSPLSEEQQEAGSQAFEAEVEERLDQLEHSMKRVRGMAREALAAMGPPALPMIAERFPGPLVVNPFAPEVILPTFPECGPLLSLVAHHGRDAHEHVQPHLDAPDAVIRFFSTYFYSSVYVPEAIPRLIQRLHDEEARICMTAARTLFGYRSHSAFKQVLDHLHGRLNASSIAARRHSAFLIGVFRDVTAIPDLIEILERKERSLTDVVESALAEITKQRFGSSPRRWRSWWAKNESKNRIEWLIEGLSSRDELIRKSACEELRAVTGQTFDYDPTSARRKREEARRKWQNWWKTEGATARTP